jgi:hypothetical protein
MARGLSFGAMAAPHAMSVLSMETRMTGILDKLHVEHGIHGARVMARSLELTSNCNSNEEIDTNIQMLKNDLDACAREMKRLVAVNLRGSLFEGWPPES